MSGAIVTIPQNDRRERFVATDGQTVFPFDFPVYAPDHVAVIRERAGVVATLTYGADYDVTGAGDQAGGSVTLTTGASAGDVIVLASAQPVARTTRFTDGGDLPAASLNAEFNRVFIAFQQVLGEFQRTVRVPDTDAGTGLVLPSSAARANGFLGFDAAGDFAVFSPDLSGSFSTAFLNQAIAAALNAALPRAVAFPFTGALADIPAGWQLCDGTNSTPDLRDRFIVAAGATRPAGSTGGAATSTTSTAGSHNHGGQTGEHALTVAQIPPHPHPVTGPTHLHGGVTTLTPTAADNSPGLAITSIETAGTGYTVGTGNTGAASTGITTTLNAGSGEAHRHAIAAGGDHTHTVPTVPPYYALAWIMRTGVFAAPPADSTVTELTEAAFSRTLAFAASDETTPIAVADTLIELPAWEAMTLRRVKVSLRIPESALDGADVEVNVRVAGTAVTAAPIVIPAGQKTVTASSLVVASVAEDALVTVDVVAAGTIAAGLKVALIGVAP